MTTPAEQGAEAARRALADRPLPPDVAARVAAILRAALTEPKREAS